MDSVEFAIFEAFIGTISVVKRNGRIIGLNITDRDVHEERRALSLFYPEGIVSELSFKMMRTLLDRYLKGERVVFDIDYDISGLNPFTRDVLAELRNIPYGETRSYGEIGRRIGSPMSGRAVGQAVGRNPIPIVIPCHRVIREDGSLGGFSLGEKLKKRLLFLEGITVKKT